VLPRRRAVHTPATLQSEIDLNLLSQELESRSAEQILQSAFDRFGVDETLFATAFGAEGMVILDLLSKVEPRAKVLYIDTQFFFRPTYELIERAKERYSFEWIRLVPELTPAQQAERFGPELYKRDPDACCRMRKVLPLQRYFEGAGLKAWIASLRRDSTPARSNVAVVHRDPVYGLVKFNPLARWTSDEVWAHIRRNGVPYNTLHDHQFPSIGCWPCTRAVRPDEDPRAGRWSGHAKTECGLHVVSGGRAS
jgi:phosphoadenosine phosphosulfate reductase